MDAPTLEWQQKHNHEKSHVDAGVRRSAYRRKSMWEAMRDRGELDSEQKQAADKLYKIYWGSMGMDVRAGENVNPDPLEYPRSYYAQKLAEARRAVIAPSLWDALMTQIQLEEFELFTDIGRKHRGVKDRRIARAHGVCLIQTALEMLAIHYGFKSSAA